MRLGLNPEFQAKIAEQLIVRRTTGMKLPVVQNPGLYCPALSALGRGTLREWARFAEERNVRAGGADPPCDPWSSVCICLR